MKKEYDLKKMNVKRRDILPAFIHNLAQQIEKRYPMNAHNYPHQAAALIQQKKANFQPKIAVILGSGLGAFAESLLDKTIIAYSDIPGFPQPKVEGHSGQLVLGYCQKTPIICLQGRSHFYETKHFDEVKTYIRTLKLLGCDILIATNAAGSCRMEVGPGSLSLITDHINFQGVNPLIGENQDEFGPRFPPLDNAYDKDLNQTFRQCAKQLQIDLAEGVYLAVSGPSYETAAEIKAFKLLGADQVAMSLVPEIIVARHCGLKCAAISIITNYATGLTTISHDHDSVVKTAQQASDTLIRLLEGFVQSSLERP